jgi:valyl-tRNA synthetase
LNILKLYAIYVPHITEYIYQGFFRQHEKTASIHLTRWVKQIHIETELIQFGENVKEVMFEMRKYKSERSLSMRSEIDFFEIHTEQRFMERFKQSEKDIKACSRAIRIAYVIDK